MGYRRKPVSQRSRQERSIREKRSHGSTHQNLDGKTVVLVLVRWLPPHEMIRVPFSEVSYDFNAGGERLKLIAIDNVELGAGTKLSREFVKRGLEMSFAKVNTRQFELIQFRAAFFCIDEGCAKKLEGSRRSPAFGKDRKSTRLNPVTPISRMPSSA